MPCEYDCCECGRHVLNFTDRAPLQPPLCAMCLGLPGWFRHPDLRATIDPDHDGRERGVDDQPPLFAGDLA